MIKKSIFILLLAVTLTACGKKDNVVDEHNYAVNPVVEEETEDVSDEPLIIYTKDDDVQAQTSEFDVVDKNSKEIDGVTYIYPTLEDDQFYINNMPIARVIPYKFALNDIIADSYEQVTNVSMDKQIYSQGYSSKLTISDLKYDSNSTDKSLTLLAPSIDYIKFGNNTFDIKELIRPTSKFEDLIKFYNSVFTSRKDGNDSDIFSYSVSSLDNELYGKTYTWIFSLEDETLEYTQDELNSIYAKRLASNDTDDSEDEFESMSYDDMNSELIVTGAYNADNKLSYYTISTNRLAHFWKMTNYNKTQQNGYDFTYNHIKLKDDSYIGIDMLEITIHNPKLTKNKQIDYNFS